MGYGVRASKSLRRKAGNERSVGCEIRKYRCLPLETENGRNILVFELSTASIERSGLCGLEAGFSVDNTGPTSRESVTIRGLQVHCLLLLCRQAYAIDKWANWNSAGSLLRLAISQGFHRDPKSFTRLSAFDAEMRRRIWATILELNVQLSIDAAMPPLISVDDYDTKPPSNLDDEDFDAISETLPSPKPKS